MASDNRSPACRSCEGRKNVDRGCLARAIMAKKAKDFSTLDLKCQILDNLCFAKSLLQISNVDHESLPQLAQGVSGSREDLDSSAV